MRGILRRRRLVALGGLLFLAGLAIVAVGLFGSLHGGESASSTVNVNPPVAATPTPLITFTPTPIEAPATSLPQPTPPLGDAPYRIIIEKINVNAPVLTFGLDANAVPEVPTGSHAAEIVAWYDFSAKPGTGSNAVFSGHVTWFGRAVFWNLKRLEIGDTIRLMGEDGTEMVYSVTESFLVNPHDPEATMVMAGTPTDMITIITCDGEYIENNDPVFGGEYTERRVVRADLVSVAVAGVPQAPNPGG